jgi:hypothetical protein
LATNMVGSNRIRAELFVEGVFVLFSHKICIICLPNIYIYIFPWKSY